MSRQQIVNGRSLRLCRSSTPAQYWVRSTETGRSLGVVYLLRSSWYWAASKAAYRGDGRPDSATDGIGDVVPNELCADGRVATQRAACAALLTHLETTRAPALGYGPHPDVVRMVSA